MLTWNGKKISPMVVKEYDPADTMNECAYALATKDFSNFPDINIPDGATKIADYAFINAKNLNSVIIPNSVTEIGKSGFQDAGILHISIGKNVQKIGNYALSGCTIVSAIYIPNTVIDIGEYCFYMTTKMPKVVFEGQAPTIRRRFAGYCYSLSVVDFRNCTSVPTLADATTPFDGVKKGCVAILPDNLYDEWINATNWVAVTTLTYVKASEYTEV